MQYKTQFGRNRWTTFSKSEVLTGSHVYFLTQTNQLVHIELDSLISKARRGDALANDYEIIDNDVEDLSADIKNHRLVYYFKQGQTGSLEMYKNQRVIGYAPSEVESVSAMSNIDDLIVVAFRDSKGSRIDLFAVWGRWRHSLALINFGLINEVTRIKLFKRGVLTLGIVAR